MAPEALPEVLLSSQSVTVMHWIREWAGGDAPVLFDLDAPYQRGSVWTDEQRRALVKSLLIKLPVGVIILSKLPFVAGRPPYRIIDGKQRIEAIRAFVSDGFPVPGWWFNGEDLDDLDARERDVVYSDLSRIGRMRIEMAPMPALEFDGKVEYFTNPEFDEDAPRGDGRRRRFLTRPRSAEEILQAEADLFGLVNAGGTPQTAADLARAEAVAGR